MNLVYIPTSLSTPEFEILLSKTQNLITEKKKVTILTCPGGKDYSCSVNLYSNPLICLVCNKKKKDAFEKIKGKFDIIKTDKNLVKKKFKYINLNKIRDFNYDGCDIGLASLSTYLDNTKDNELEGKIAKEVLLKNINITLNLYKFYRKLIQSKKFKNVFLYNGRQNQYRPLVRVLTKYKINMILMEFKGPKFTNVYEFKNNMIFDFNLNFNEIEKTYKKFKNEKLKIKALVDNFYRAIALGKKVQQNLSFNKDQEKNLLPVSFNKKEENLVFFISSEFEYSALGGIYDKTIYSSQVEALIRICNDLSKSKKKIKVWVRIHPNLKDVKWSYMYEYCTLKKKYSFLNIIPPNSKISSYALLYNSTKVISFNSRMGIEAVYAKKPSILLNRNPYEQLGSNYLPKNHGELMKLIFSDLKPKSTLGSDKYALWCVAGGGPLKGFKGSYKKGFLFHNKKTRTSLYYSILYYLGRVIDKYYFFYFRNIGIKILLKTFFLRR